MKSLLIIRPVGLRVQRKSILQPESHFYWPEKFFREQNEKLLINYSFLNYTVS